MSEPKIVEYGEPCRGNTGEWGRTVVYEVEGPFGKMSAVDWERLPEPDSDSDVAAS